MQLSRLRNTNRQHSVACYNPAYFNKVTIFKKQSSARLRAPRLPEPMTAADRAVVALRTRRHNRSK